MDASIIIVNYNTKEYLRNCLDSVFDKTEDITYEVIIVDNDSKDGSPEMIKKEFPQVKLIENNENLGFGRANNLGAKVAKGKYLFFLNSDTILLNNAIQKFFAFMEQSKNDQIGATGTLLLNEDRTIGHSFGSFPSQTFIFKTKLKYWIYKYFGSEMLRRKPRAVNITPEQLPFEVDFITGADLFVPAKIFKQLDGFDPRFFLYFEETDLQKRMQKLGLKRLIISGPEIIHREWGSFIKKKRNNQLKFYFESFMLYAQIHKTG